jgi:hypothetical protein
MFRPEPLTTFEKADRKDIGPASFRLSAPEGEEIGKETSSESVSVVLGHSAKVRICPTEIPIRSSLSFTRSKTIF